VNSFEVKIMLALLLSSDLIVPFYVTHKHKCNLDYYSAQSNKVCFFVSLLEAICFESPKCGNLIKFLALQEHFENQ
jgi:hypothetical protein